MAGHVVLSVNTVPSEIYQFHNLTQHEGTTAVLTCLSRGDPAPNMTLFKLTRHGQLHRIHAVCQLLIALVVMLIVVTFASLMVWWCSG